jgi:antirestriction protein
MYDPGRSDRAVVCRLVGRAEARRARSLDDGAARIGLRLHLIYLGRRSRPPRRYTYRLEIETMNDTPRIYVACLSAYNNAHLHGAWIDCDRDSDEIMDDIKAMLVASPMPDAEEWAIHDYEGFHGITISEHESLDRLVELAEKLEEHGEAFAAFLDHYNFEDIDDFEDRYQGCYKNKQDFAEEYYEQSGMIKQFEGAGLKSCYIDFEMIARDMFIDGYSGIDRGHETLYVFSDY